MVEFQKYFFLRTFYHFFRPKIVHNFIYRFHFESKKNDWLTAKYVLKFIHSEKLNIFFWKISTVDLSYKVTVKSTVEILQYFVAFSEWYMNFKVHGFLNNAMINWFITGAKNAFWDMPKLLSHLHLLYVQKWSIFEFLVCLQCTLLVLIDFCPV